MRVFEIEFDIKYFHLGKLKEKHILIEECYDILLTDKQFSFINVYNGLMYNYYLKDIPESQSAKEIYNLMITEVKD